MFGNVEHFATLTFVLLTVTLTFNQGHGQKRTCGFTDRRPHPHGICGSQLAEAHHRLCFLVRQSYSNYYPQNKRSPWLDSGELNYLPLPRLEQSLASGADLNLDLQNVLETPFSVSRNGNRKPPLTKVGIHGKPYSGDSIDAITSGFSKRWSRYRRSLVCECCYGPCSTRILMRYC